MHPAAEHSWEQRRSGFQRLERFVQRIEHDHEGSSIRRGGAEKVGVEVLQAEAIVRKASAEPVHRQQLLAQPSQRLLGVERMGESAGEKMQAYRLVARA